MFIAKRRDKTVKLISEIFCEFLSVNNAPGALYNLFFIFQFTIWRWNTSSGGSGVIDHQFYDPLGLKENFKLKEIIHIIIIIISWIYVSCSQCLMYTLCYYNSILCFPKSTCVKLNVFTY